MSHLQRYIKMTTTTVLAVSLCAPAFAQTPAPAPQTVVFEVPVDITHPANVVVVVGCKVEDAVHTSLAKNLVSVPLSTPVAPAATVRDTLDLRVGVRLDSHQVEVARQWKCQMMRGEGIGLSNLGPNLPSVSGDKLLSTVSGFFP